MGCAGSKAASLVFKESPLSEALERKLVHSVITTKRRKSFSVKRSSFNNLMLQMPKLTLGFKKIREAYAVATGPTGKVTWGTFRSTCDKKLWLAPTDTLKEVLTMPEVDDRVPVSHADLIIIYMVVFLIDARLKRNTINSPEVRSCLDLMEKSFMFFDSSADGCIERKELAMALKSGTRVFGRKASKTLADQLFDQLDWSKDGQITFKEYLVGMERIIIETAGDEDEEDEMECEEEEEEDLKDMEGDWEDEGAKQAAKAGPKGKQPHGQWHDEVPSPGQPEERSSTPGGQQHPQHPQPPHPQLPPSPPRLAHASSAVGASSVALVEPSSAKAVGESGDEVRPFTLSGVAEAEAGAEAGRRALGAG